MLGGDAKQSLYPEISEWGNPPIFDRYPCMWERTQGSETSQYQEEKKANTELSFCLHSIGVRKKVLAIPLVAASETGGAQTIHVYMGGVVGQKRHLVEKSYKLV